MNFEFHMHSVYSDGSSTVEEIFESAKSLKLSALAITDHDTVLGLEKTNELSKKYGIPFIPAAEFTALENDIRFHVLGYGIDYNSSELIGYSKDILEKLNNKSRKQIKLMQKNGINIQEEEFYKEGQGGPLYRAKMLKVLSKHGYLKKENIMTSLRFYFGKDAPYYVEDNFKYYGFQEICNLIKNNNGIVVLAHPEKIKKKDDKLYENLINSSLLDGLEIYHPANSLKLRQELKGIADKKGLIITGGSDYHGEYNKAKTPICGIEIPKCIYDNLSPYLQNK